MIDVEIDWNNVAFLLEAGCSGSAIADYLGIHENTLYNRCKKDLDVEFVAFKAKNKSKGDLKLLTAQYEIAVYDKDKDMLKWLGKQRLSQSDKVQNDNRNTFPDEIVIRRVGNDYQTKGTN